MKLQQTILLLTLCIAYSTPFTLSSIFGGGTEVTTADEVASDELSLEAPEEKKKKPYKPLKPYKPEITKKPIKTIKQVKNKIKKIKDFKKKKATFLSYLALPFFSFHKNTKNTLNKIIPTKTEYVEVTKRITVSPVCYITLKKKKPCIKQSHLGLQHEEINEDEQKLEVEEDMGDLEDDEEGWPWTRQSKSIETDSEEEEVTESFDSVEATEDEDTARITYTVDVSSEESEEEGQNRQGRYIDFVEPAEASEEEYPLESSEDVEARIKNLAWATKTVLVTRVERYTDTKVTATVIAKNCAPVNPSVPRCPKKKHVVIRDRPDHDGPLIIESTPALIATPPIVTFHAKEIIDDQVSDASETVETSPNLTIVEKA